MKRFTGQPSWPVVVAAIGLLAGIGGIAFAAIPDSSDVIHGCYHKNNGNLRVVDSSNDCRKSEKAIQWNQTGPAGPPGPPSPGGGGVTKLTRTDLPVGSSRVLFTQGPLTFTASCQRRDVGLPSESVTATVTLTTSQDHAVVDRSGDEIGKNGEPSEFGPSQPVELLPFGATEGRPLFISIGFTAGAPDGTGVTGTLYAGVNVLNRADHCIFGGYYVPGV